MGDRVVPVWQDVVFSDGERFGAGNTRCPARLAGSGIQTHADWIGDQAVSQRVIVRISSLKKRALIRMARMHDMNQSCRGDSFQASSD